MDKTNKPATLHDVAAYCGVSYQTVSRVVNESPQVSPKTRRRVLDAIKALGYQPNKAARMLVTRRSSILEIITYGLNYYGPVQMVTGVERAARQLGYRLMFADLDGMLPDEIEAILDNLGRRSVDGTAVIAPIENPIFEQIEHAYRGQPLLKISTHRDQHIPSVAIDQAKGSQLVTQHLIMLGHTRIAEIRGPAQWYDATARHASWLATLAANRLEPVASEAGNWTSASGYEAAHRLLNHGATFTGLVVGNDQMALGAIRALRERGLLIPQDVSVVGFDDIPEAAYFEPPLTTVRQDFGSMGKQAIEYLVQIINDPQTVQNQRLLYPELIERESTQAV